MNFSHSIDRGQVALTFDGKPSAEVRAILKGQRFQWNPRAGNWWRRSVSGAADLILAVRKQIDKESGVRRPDGPCWDCKDPAGFFRPFAAATPVYCDACHEKHTRDQISQYTERSAPDFSDTLYEDQCRDACGL